jgi:hypothetical protein
MAAARRTKMTLTKQQHLMPLSATTQQLEKKKDTSIFKL